MSRLIVIFLTLFTAVSWAEQFSVGVVSDVENEASVVIKGEEKKLSVGMFIEKGSKIVTGKASKVKIMMMDDSLLIIAPGTEFSIDDYAIDTDKKSRKSVLGVIRGKVLFYVNKAFSKQGSKFEVKTRSSIAGVRGTKFFVESTEKEFVGVINGEVELRTQDKEIILSGGKCVDSSSGFVVSDLDPQMLQEYTEGFQIKKGKTQVAMLERGTGIRGEALIESGVKDGSFVNISSIGTEKREHGDKKAESFSGEQGGGDFGEGIGETISDQRNKDGKDISDVIVGGKSIVRIKILLPFVKARR